jgi:hypothetical protein
VKDRIVEKLRALLRGYGEGRSPATTGTRGVADEAERRRRECGELLRRVVRPVLDAFMAEAHGAGHEANVTDDTESANAYPSVALSFAPRAGGLTALASILTFRYDPRRGVAVQRDIKPPVSKTRVVTTSADRIGTMKVEAVTADWVETKTLSFVEAVLQVNR